MQLVAGILTHPLFLLRGRVEGREGEGRREGGKEDIIINTELSLLAYFYYISLFTSYL